MEQGLLMNCTHDTVLRFLPPYIATEKEIDRARGDPQARVSSWPSNVAMLKLKRALSSGASAIALASRILRLQRRW